jgi:hypothetical protein
MRTSVYQGKFVSIITYQYLPVLPPECPQIHSKKLSDNH